MGITENKVETKYRAIGEMQDKKFVKKLLTKNILVKINNKEEIKNI